MTKHYKILNCKELFKTLFIQVFEKYGYVYSHVEEHGGSGEKLIYILPGTKKQITLSTNFFFFCEVITDPEKGRDWGCWNPISLDTYMNSNIQS